MRRLITIALLCASAHAMAGADFKVSDMLRIKRISRMSVSPDGRQVVFEMGVPDLTTNRLIRHLYVVPATGGEPHQITNGESSESEAWWSPDSKSIIFVADRDGTSQIWSIGIAGGEALKITSLSTGASAPLYSPDGKSIAFISDVYPDLKKDNEQKARDEALSKETVKARLIEHLMYRHWDTWSNGKRRHIMIVPSAGGECRDLTPGDIDSPPLTIDSGGFAFSPDSREICFCRNNAADTAVSTNNDLFTVDLATGAIMQITDNPGSDTSPAYSPDGRFIAYLTQLRPGYESDRAELMIYDRSGKTKKYLTDTLDRSIDDFVFAPDGKIIFFSCEDSGYRPLYSVAPLNPRPKKILDNITAGSIAAAGGDVFFVSESFNEPIDIYASASGRKTPRRLTSVNASFLLPFELKQAESVTYTGAAGTAIQGWVVKPSSFRPDKKYPLLVIIHGGPHDAHLNAFSYRWNAQVLANAGPFVIFLPNPRGSTGFGQAFCDGINKDWGGKVYIDIMTGVEYMAKQPFIDGEKVAAAGGSFGGYMVNWMAGRTDRFKALVCHAGLFNLPAFYGTTEELWFPEWEFGGCPWDTPESYEAWSPLANANNIKTPMLLIHGEQDYRVSISEAQQLFSILQRRHIPSKFLWFPDEGHSIQKPKNVMLWYSTVLSWLRQYLIES